MRSSGNWRSSSTAASLRPAASFEIGDVLVDTFSVPHDAQDPVGFLLRTPAANIGFLTDLGHATKLVIERVRCANVLSWKPITM